VSVEWHAAHVFVASMGEGSFGCALASVPRAGAADADTLAAGAGSAGTAFADAAAKSAVKPTTRARARGLIERKGG